MKAYLMHRDRDFDLESAPPANEEELVGDLELNTLFAAMANGDQFLFEVARRAVLASLANPEEIVYRQRVLADCLERPELVRELYGISIEGLQAKRRALGFLSDSPDAILSRSVDALEYLVGTLRKLREFANTNAGGFRSEGFKRLCAMVAEELDDAYFERVEAHLRELRFRRGVLMSARLGPGNRGVDYVLRRQQRPGWVKRVAQKVRRPTNSFEIPPRDDAGFKALTELRARGINLVANALAQSTDHILAFFAMLRTELAFYVGCVNLHERLTAKSEPTCFPTPVAARERALSARGLYDVCLTLHLGGRAIGNELAADGRDLAMITGANQGGKSTFLRSVGLGQLMMQSGMFVAAQEFRASPCKGLFTHYKREEDRTMRRGKLDEELARMSEIADRIVPGAMLLCNESFSATNEREGSEIARQVVRALSDAGVRVLFVTHLYDLAHGLHAERSDTALFLRAERLSDGRRTFRVVEGEPLPTSYGEDSFKRIFGATAAKRAVAAAGGS
jgi:hypothetical protein